MCLCFIRKLFTKPLAPEKVQRFSNYTTPRLPSAGAMQVVYSDPRLIPEATQGGFVQQLHRVERNPVFVENELALNATLGLTYEPVHILGADKQRKMDIDNGQ